MIEKSYTISINKLTVPVHVAYTKGLLKLFNCLTWYIEYKVVAAVQLTRGVYDAARIDAVVGSRDANDLDAAVTLSESNSLTTKQSIHQPNKQKLYNR